ncbi:MAG: Uncharacterized metal-dependent hydrolase YcfH, partial [uncultured Rubrobacteraceae bacterium]
GRHAGGLAHSSSAAGGLAGGSDEGGRGGRGRRGGERGDRGRRLAARGGVGGRIAQRVLDGRDTPAQRGDLHSGGPGDSGRTRGVARDCGARRGGVGLLPLRVVEGGAVGVVRGCDLARQRHAAAARDPLQAGLRRHDGLPGERQGAGRPPLLRGRRPRGPRGHRTRLLRRPRREHHLHQQRDGQGAPAHKRGAHPRGDGRPLPEPPARARQEERAEECRPHGRLRRGAARFRRRRVRHPHRPQRQELLRPAARSV